MRKAAAAIPILALLLITGCGAEPTEPGAASAPASAAASAPASAAAGAGSTAEALALDSAGETCRRLLGADGNGPLQQVTSLVKIGGGTSRFEGSVETARALHQEIQGLAKHAPEQMLPQLKELSSPVENTLVIADSPGSAWTFNPETWTRAAAELETGCAPYRAR